MKVLLLNQCFYPDVMATGQYLTQLAVSLTERGHNVTVITSDRGYDNPEVRFASRETWNGISIVRIPSLALGKKSKWRRALNFGSFLTICSLQLLTMHRFDVVVALTSPPLISFLGALFARIKGSRFCFWVMDLNPDEAIAAGWLKEDAFSTRTLQGLLYYSLRHAHSIIVLDRFMKDRILKKGIDERPVFVIPPWSHGDSIAFDQDGRDSFRSQYGIKNKFVVMYSGNHSPCHPLDTLMRAALALRDRKDVVFYFIGGGSEQKKVREFADAHSLKNLCFLPYQPLERLSASLSAADLHVVAMGNEFVGIVHPSKVYNIMAVGAPILYLGPAESHITDIATHIPEKFHLASHGDVDAVVNAIKAVSSSRDCRDVNAGSNFSKQDLLPQIISLLEAGAICSDVGPESVATELNALREQ